MMVLARGIKHPLDVKVCDRDSHLDDRFHEIDHGTNNLLADSSFVVDQTRSGIMAGWRRGVELAMAGEEIETLGALSRGQHRAFVRQRSSHKLIFGFCR